MPDLRSDWRAGAVIWFYLSKALLPIRLLFIYPMWHIEVARLLWWLPVIAGIVVTVVVLRNGSPARAKWGRGVLFAWAFFCVALAPVLGLTDVGFMQYSLVADHYQHLAIIGVVAAVAAGWAAWRDASRTANRSVANIAALALVGILAWLTFEQSGLYANSVNLYEETLRFNPECWAAHNNLGVQLDVAGRPQEAEQHFEEALHLKPNYAEAHYNLGNSLAKAGDRVAAIKQYREALRLRPGYIEARNNLGIELSHAGRTAEAIECLRESLRFESRAVTYFNLGNVFSEANCPRDAAEQYERAVELRPDYAEAWANLAATYGDLGRWAEAQAAASKAIDLANAQGLTGVIKGIEAWRTPTHRSLPQLGRGADLTDRSPERQITAPLKKTTPAVALSSVLPGSSRLCSPGRRAQADNGCFSPDATRRAFARGRHRAVRHRAVDHHAADRRAGARHALVCHALVHRAYRELRA